MNELTDDLVVILPPDGVRLVSSRPSKTGEGGRGVVARYSDGTTASAMVNSDGSVCVLFFRGGETVPALPLDGPGPPRFTWSRSSPTSHVGLARPGDSPARPGLTSDLGPRAS